MAVSKKNDEKIKYSKTEENYIDKFSAYEDGLLSMALDMICYDMIYLTAIG